MAVANAISRAALRAKVIGQLRPLRNICPANKRYTNPRARLNATTAFTSHDPVSQKEHSLPQAPLGASWRSDTVRDHVHPIPNVEHNFPAQARVLLFESGELKVHDESQKTSTRVPGRWLRDNCACSQCRNTDTAQRQINVLKGGLNTTISHVEFERPDDSHMIVTFEDGHRSTYKMGALLQRRSHRSRGSRAGIVPLQLWTSTIAAARPAVQYKNVTTHNGMGVLLQNIRRYGFCIVEDMPPTPEATEAFLESIGPIRNTHYGGFYDFTSDLTMKDTAYTSEFLEPHTDNTYFTEPAGIQALHMLSHTEGSGGESSLTDGFNAAARLFTEDREAYLTLSQVGVYAHASGNEGISIQPSQAFPVLNHDPEGGHLTQVRWNNADRAGIAADFDLVEKWYAAAERFDRLLGDKDNQYWFQLQPGQTLLFDNWRVLHGRNEFTGKRRMCGGYINRDDFISKYRMMNLSKEDIELSTVSG